ncbi:MAG: glycosyltransferase, partial [Candidatus Binatia bacterium]
MQEDRPDVVDPTNQLPFDRYQRYAFAARAVGALRIEDQPLRLLEVGANVHHDLEKFLPRDQIVYLDLERPVASTFHGTCVQGDATAAPFRKGAFDVVIALDVLEHIPPEKRPDFLSTMLWAANQGVIMAAPFQTAEGEAQELRLNTYFRDLHGSDYPWLAEHQARGLPDLDDTLRRIRSLGWAALTWGHGNLHLWAKLIQAHFYVNSEPELLPLRGALDQLYNREIFARDWAAPVYRHFIVAASSSHDLDRLQNLFETTQSVCAQDLLLLQQHLDRLYEHGDRQRYKRFREALTSLQEERQQNGRAFAYALELKDTVIQHQETQLHVRAEAALQDARQIEALKTDNAKLKRHLIQSARVQADLLHSLSWRVTAPLRRLNAALSSVRRLLRRRLHAMRLEPVQDLTLQDGEFHSTGHDPQIFLYSSHKRLPSAWVVIAYDTETYEQPLDPRLYVDSGSGFSEDHQLALPFRTKGRVEWRVRLPNRVCALRLDPLSMPGRFALRDMTIQELGTFQVVATLLWSHLQPVMSQPRQLLRQIRKAWTILRTNGFNALQHRLFAPGAADYQQWVVAYDTLTGTDRALISRAVERLTYRPLISIVMPTYNTPEKWLRRAIESVRNQLYPHWELCLADDASSAPHVRQVLEEYRAQDARITVVYREQNGHISAASNSAIALATGDFIALLDHDDELTAHALYMVAAELNAHPQADLLYSDEDKIDAHGQRHHPYFKPDWNPDLFLAQNLVTHLCVCRTSLVREVGGFHAGYEGAQDWDLVMRISERIPPAHIRHIPHVLYHWRAIPGSTALAVGEKDYAREAQYKMLVSHFARIRQQVEILPVAGACWRIQYPVPQPPPLVTLIIPTRDRVDLLRRCVESIYQKTTYPRFEIIIVDNQSEDPRTLTYLRQVAGERGVTVLQYDAPFNYSAINNYAAQHARGEVLGFLNNDIEVISPAWLTEMVSQALRPEIGAVGAMLYYPNNTIQHAGVILGLGTSSLCAHAFIYQPRGYPGPIGRALLSQNLSAVTAACMVLRRAVFAEVEGLDDTHLAIAYNDVDLCLR